MIAGWLGTLSTTTFMVCAGLLHNALFAVTVMVPEFVPAVAFILTLEELPDQPPGKVQV